MLSSATVVALGTSKALQPASLSLSSNDAKDTLSFHLTISNHISLSSNDNKDTLSFALSLTKSLRLITNDSVDTMSSNFFTPPNTTVILPAQLDLSITIEEITYNNRWGYLA